MRYDVKQIKHVKGRNKFDWYWAPTPLPCGRYLTLSQAKHEAAELNKADERVAAGLRPAWIVRGRVTIDDWRDSCEPGM